MTLRLGAKNALVVSLLKEVSICSAFFFLLGGLFRATFPLYV